MGHELVHHKQNCDGQFDDAGDMGKGYAQSNPHLRQMEMNANRDGSMCLRDFEDKLKEENTTSLLMPTMKWQVDKEIYSQQLELLRLDAIIWSNNYAKELSTTLNKRCTLKQIHINGNISRPVHYNSEVRMLKSSAKVEMPMVEKTEETISITPNIVLECR